MSQRLRLGCWLLAVIIAALQAFATRYTMNADALSYLDLARAYSVRNSGYPINPYWGPLYPSLLALAFSIARPSPARVFPTVHAANFGVFLGAMAAFDYFLQELLRTRESEASQKPAIRNAALAAYSYAIFIYSALGLIGLQLVTPDLCVAAVTFAAAGLMLGTLRRVPSWPLPLLLGLVLGLGYLAKSVMFILGVVLVVTVPLLPKPSARALRRAAIAASSFAAVAMALIIPITRQTGTLTFGTSGKLSYEFNVNKVPYTNWQGNVTPSRGPLHPPRRVQQDPEIFEYTNHLIGTYPPWYDPTYWTAGVETEFNALNQVRALYRTSGFYANVFLGGPGVLPTLLLLLLWLCPGNIRWRKGLGQYLPLITFAVAGMAIYLPVNVESRYIAAFAALLWLIPLAAAQIDVSEVRQHWLNCMALLCTGCLVIPVGLHAVSDAWESRHGRSPHPIVAAHLRNLGIQPEARVANIGRGTGERGSSFEAFWAYLAQVQIAAEIPDGRDFLCADDPTAARVYSSLARLGVRAVVTMAMPSRRCAQGWSQVEGTEYYVKLLDDLQR